MFVFTFEFQHFDDSNNGNWIFQKLTNLENNLIRAESVIKVVNSK
jgi:hypothetical protein